MDTLVIEDSREYIFQVFSVSAEDNGIFLESRVFLGTAFLVTQCGDAITANHVIPKPEALQEGHRLVATVLENGQEKVCWITHTAKFDSGDAGLIHLNLKPTKYLEVSEEQVAAGTDVLVVGIPSHEVWGSGKEMRVLKGNITLSGNYLELNFPIPSGMSVSPDLLVAKAVGYATGSVRSEEIEGATEEIEEISKETDVVRISEIRGVIHYGLACPFSLLSEICDPVIDGKTLYQFIVEHSVAP